MRKIILSLFLFSSLTASSQDTLPGFSVENRGNNRIVIGWYNNYPMIKQISIQRSFDSLNNYKTILTVPDPMNRQNGYMDTRAPNDHMFYRLYMLFDGGHFLFSKPRKPFSDTALIRVIQKSLTDSVLTPEEIFLLRRMGNNKFDVVNEAISKPLNSDLKDKNKPDLMVPTYRVTANRDGNVGIRLKDFDKKKYSVRFFDDDDSFLFEIKEVKQAVLIIDKANFHHSGWFKFELYEDGKLAEKHQFFIPKDF